VDNVPKSDQNGPPAPTSRSPGDARHRAVATVIAASRREVGMTQDRLADALHWHRSRIAQIESGQRRVDVPEFIAIALALQLDPAQLLGRVVRW
jgi:DNA-binding XRE family transcriptional regulator